MQPLPKFTFIHWRQLWRVSVLLLYVTLAGYQLGLPGLHYDEAREAGVNAMELLTGAPVTAFRSATFTFGAWQLPLMVQDYIGALNVYLALPFLWLTGIGVPNLRALSILTGVATLLLLERAVAEWELSCELRSANYDQQAISDKLIAIHNSSAAGYNSQPTIRNSQLAALLTITLVAASPSFVFWSRQGIFVTNLTQPLCFWCIWQGLRWFRTGQPTALLISAFAGGCALYAKLIAIWVIGPMGLFAGGWWLWRRTHRADFPHLSMLLLVGAIVAFYLPLTPMLLFNIKTRGAIDLIAAHWQQSYYGVDNFALLTNFETRWQQLGQMLRGDHLWYLGGVYGNWLAPWGVGIGVFGALRRWRCGGAPLLLLVVTFLCSLFTLSDLFITHDALLQPIALAAAGVGLATLLQRREKLVTIGGLFCLLLWVMLDITTTLRYHHALTQSGGLADHSDASYHLAYYLRYNGLGAPVALDWGMDATIRYLSEGKVTPIEIFGYISLHEPDAEFVSRLQPFLANPDNVYLLRAPEQSVFKGRREAFLAATATAGMYPKLEKAFRQRDGTQLFELWRVRSRE